VGYRHFDRSGIKPLFRFRIWLVLTTKFSLQEFEAFVPRRMPRAPAIGS